ncbi:Small subunit (SSU) processome component [Linnemannia elongata]|nr:Small subunit (SSU) processome component [Linnemannia elongata]
MLIQALHSNDLQLLEACLTYNNVDVIRNTVRRLPTAYVIPFLTQVIHKFQQKPSRGEALLEWIKAVLLIHTAYLMTVPDLVKKLSNFYQTLDSRVSVYSKLINLHGRLDLVMSQVEMQHKDTEDISNVAQTVYREDEDDDEDEDDMDLEDDGEDEELADEDDESDSDDDSEGLDSEMSDDDDDDEDSSEDDEDEDEE